MEVRIFASGKEFQSALSLPPDVDRAVIDLQMPGIICRF
jgi:hypothetical protein